ncbi:hypothetical protein I79_007969 [Cricetulus griseus]|uniref:Uncharacterized protein n=1 Tax=Cricetulus griseus TaxID=10029 RepID=G3HBR1_CRIGR|nr:hypothetical protein I79_007969 [Cricetulus griseus]
MGSHSGFCRGGASVGYQASRATDQPPTAHNSQNWEGQGTGQDRGDVGDKRPDTDTH